MASEDQGSTKTAKVHIRHDDDGQVVVHPANSDRFALQMKRAVLAMEIGHQQMLLVGQVELLLKRLANWLAPRVDVLRAVVGVRGDRVQFVVLREGEYSQEFEHELSTLEQEVAQDPDLDLVRYFESMGLHGKPLTSVESFVDPRAFVVEYQIPSDGQR